MKYNLRDKEQLTLTHRRCRKCNEQLYSNRYFECEECKPELPNSDEDYIYCDWDDLED